MSIAVINKDKTLIFNYGFANKLKNIPTTNDTIYTIASFTKTFTATLAAIASVDKKLNLDEPFIKYFPELQNDNNLDKLRLVNSLRTYLPFHLISTTTKNLSSPCEEFKSIQTPKSAWKRIQLLKCWHRHSGLCFTKCLC